MKFIARKGVNVKVVVIIDVLVILLYFVPYLTYRTFAWGIMLEFMAHAYFSRPIFLDILTIACILVGLATNSTIWYRIIFACIGFAIPTVALWTYGHFLT